MEEDVAAHPRDVRLLSPAAVVTCADRFTDAIEQSRLGRRRCRLLPERVRLGVQSDRIASESNRRQLDQAHRLSARTYPIASQRASAVASSSSVHGDMDPCPDRFERMLILSRESLRLSGLHFLDRVQEERRAIRDPLRHRKPSLNSLAAS